jgi:hypothetical protein
VTLDHFYLEFVIEAADVGPVKLDLLHERRVHPMVNTMRSRGAHDEHDSEHRSLTTVPRIQARICWGNASLVYRWYRKRQMSNLGGARSDEVVE